MAAERKGREPGQKLEPLWDRLQGKIDWYDEKAKRNQRAYKASKIAIVVLAILIPVLAEYGFLPGFHDSRAFLVGVASGGIILLEGLQVLNKWQENWILYRATCEGLRNEQHLYAEKAGPYAGLKPDIANRVLAERTSSLVMAEHGKWAKAHEHKVETTSAVG
ncbi:MAG TPA: DUF4231 domain-containing protein [Methyloceanibacter sp.]|nr:DUF4231 domain-containing protein [Methyloceanibacter sp.]